MRKDESRPLNRELSFLLSFRKGSSVQSEGLDLATVLFILRHIINILFKISPLSNEKGRIAI